MYSNTQSGDGLKDLFKNISRKVAKKALPVVKKVGIDLAKNIGKDIISGKLSKDSVKSLGKQAGKEALQGILKGGGPSPSDFGSTRKVAKRKRSTSKTSSKRRRTQKGEGWDQVFNTYEDLRKLAGYGKRKSRKKAGRKQTGGRRTTKKRKTRKQTGGWNTPGVVTNRKRNVPFDDIFS